MKKSFRELERALQEIYRSDFKPALGSTLRETLLDRLPSLPPVDHARAPGQLESELLRIYQSETVREPAPKLRDQLLSRIESVEILPAARANRALELEAKLQELYRNSWEQSAPSVDQLISKLPRKVRAARNEMNDPGVLDALIDALVATARISIPVAAVMVITLMSVGMVPKLSAPNTIELDNAEDQQ